MQKNRRKIQVEISEKEFRGKIYSIELYAKESEDCFAEDSELLAQDFIVDQNGYRKISGDRAIVLQSYGPTKIEISHFQGGMGMFSKGYVVRAEVDSGVDASDFIKQIQHELAPLTEIKDGELVKRESCEAKDSKGRKQFTQSVYFSALPVEQAFLIYVTEK